uniref:Probable splicing factor YJU2B n=1 Tax=Molossus molossus TaxID=27622 RepID=A0A7J8I898_MOLMO|nr:hypothetical protein HJG59_010620 [Molossus molossus]
MGERKGVNKYYPPDFNPEKHGSLNRYHKSHPLRERARKLSQGILIIRFEMPYNIWCDGCKNHIGMGVRYNAEKKKVGNYYTTPIYRFRMKCHLCINYIEMQTDPANCDYVIVSGAQRKEERWDMADNEQVLTTEHEKKQKLETDAMFRLEHGEADRSTLKKALPTLSHIQEAQSAWKDDFALNSMLLRPPSLRSHRCQSAPPRTGPHILKTALRRQPRPPRQGDLRDRMGAVRRGPGPHQVRGAPAIALVGCLSLAVELQAGAGGPGLAALVAFVRDALNFLVTARPTAVNMARAACDLADAAAQEAEREGATEKAVRERVICYAEDMLEKDLRDNRSIGDLGAHHLLARVSPAGSKVTVLTHCNTGALATAGYGTALGE